MRSFPRSWFLLCVTLSAILPLRAALPVPDPDDGGLILPPGFRALVVADNLVVGKRVGNTPERLRHLAIAPNGDIYAKGKFGGIFAMRDTNGDGRMDQFEQFGPGDGGTHIAFHNGWLYHSSRTAVYRYPYVPGELVPSGPMQTLVSGLPAERDHDAKAFAFDDQGGMLVEIGSPYNVYADGDRRQGAKGKDATEFLKTYGGFWCFDAERNGQTQQDGTRFSTGHRHALALTWHPVSKAFFMVQMGRDNMNVVAPDFYDELDNAERVSEVMHRVNQGSNFGWPYSYYDPIKKAHMVAPEFGGDNRQRVADGTYDKPVVAFPGHWAPLGMTMYQGTQFPEKYRNGMFVTFHGSWNRAPRFQDGYKVAFVPVDENGSPTGEYEVFADNFAMKSNFVATREARHRPGGVAQGPDGSLYVTDTVRGRIWRIIYTGEDAPATVAQRAMSLASPSALVDVDTIGGRVYQQMCAACHMPNGTGVPGMLPPLVGSAVVAGDTQRLLAVLLHGPAAVLPADREKFGTVMPPFAALSDAEIAGVANFVRKNFASASGEIAPADVAAARAR